MRLLLVAAAVAGLVGCSETGAYVRQRGARTLDCPPADVQVEHLRYGAWVVTGCDTEVFYSCIDRGDAVRCSELPTAKEAIAFHQAEYLERARQASPQSSGYHPPSTYNPPKAYLVRDPNGYSHYTYGYQGSPYPAPTAPLPKPSQPSYQYKPSVPAYQPYRPPPPSFRPYR